MMTMLVMTMKKVAVQMMMMTMLAIAKEFLCGFFGRRGTDYWWLSRTNTDRSRLVQISHSDSDSDSDEDQHHLVKEQDHDVDAEQFNRSKLTFASLGMGSLIDLAPPVGAK